MHRENIYRVVGFINRDGEVVEKFEDCSVAMVYNETEEMSHPRSKTEFDWEAKVNDRFLETIEITKL